MKTEKLVKAVEQLARSLAQRYDLDYDLVLTASKAVLAKLKNLKEMKDINTLEWQKKAGILTESQYREAKEALTEETNARNLVKEMVAKMLQEKKKRKKKTPEPEPEPTPTDVDMDMDTEMEPASEPSQPSEPMMGGGASKDADLLQKTLDFLQTVGQEGDEKYRQMLQNAVAYQAKKINAEN